MIYLFDENVSVRLVKFMQDMGEPGIHHLAEIYRLGTLDTELIPSIARDGYILVTNDQRMRKDHRALLAEYRIPAVFLPPKWSNLGMWGQAEFMFRHWRLARAVYESSDHKAYVRLTARGAVERL